MADEIDAFLDGYADDVAKIARAARAQVRKLFPDANEELKRGWKSISYKRGKRGMGICAIIPHTEWVNLQFFDGANLEDPDGLLEGSGKAMRHVKLRTVKDVSRKNLGELIRRAAGG